MVFTKDLSPQNLKKLENRLRSRFQASAVARITPPDLEMRTAILRRRSQSEHVEFQNDAINFIAANVSENIRELEGALSGRPAGGRRTFTGYTRRRPESITGSGTGQ